MIVKGEPVADGSAAIASFLFAFGRKGKSKFLLSSLRTLRLFSSLCADGVRLILLKVL
jgi:hypothetical protein